MQITYFDGQVIQYQVQYTINGIFVQAKNVTIVNVTVSNYEDGLWLYYSRRTCRNNCINIRRKNNPIEAKIELGEEIQLASKATFAVGEGIYTLRVEKEGYVPVIVDLSIRPGETRTLTVVLYKKA